MMELLARNKKGNQPIHVRRWRLAPIQHPKSKKQPEPKLKSDSSPKNNDLPKIAVLDSAELHQYMSCGGIKLGIRFNLSIQKRGKRKRKQQIEQKTVSLLPCEGTVSTAPCTFLGKLSKKSLFPLRRSKMFQSPSDFKYMYRPLEIPAEELVLGRHFKTELCGFYTVENTYVGLAACEGVFLEPPPHPHLSAIVGVTEISGKRYYVLRQYGCESLKSMLLQFGKVTAKMGKIYLRQIIGAVLHLHKNRLFHNRLNLDSILHDGQGGAIVNWLLGSKDPPTEQQKRRHFHFFPPEALLSRNYDDSEKNDVWAIGCIALQFQSQVPLRKNTFHPYNRQIDGNMSQSSDTLRRVQQLMGTVGLVLPELRGDVERESMGVLGSEFVALCLSVNLSRRASLQQLLCHPFLSN